MCFSFEKIEQKKLKYKYSNKFNKLKDKRLKSISWNKVNYENTSSHIYSAYCT